MVNQVQFKPPGTREKELSKEMAKYAFEEGILTKEKLQKIKEECEERIKSMDVEQDILDCAESLLNDEKYKANFKDLEIYKNSYHSDFVTLKDQVECSLKRLEMEVVMGSQEMLDIFKGSDSEIQLNFDKEIHDVEVKMSTIDEDDCEISLGSIDNMDSIEPSLSPPPNDISTNDSIAEVLRKKSSFRVKRSDGFTTGEMKKNCSQFNIQALAKQNEKIKNMIGFPDPTQPLKFKRKKVPQILRK